MKRRSNWRNKARKWSMLAAALPMLLAAFPAGASAADPALAVSQLSSSLTKEQLVQAFLGDSVTVSNVTFSGQNVQAGTFDGGNGIIGIDKGIMLSSGNIANVIGPNQDTGIGDDLGGAGDADLTALAEDDTYDASVLEFDFVPAGDVLKFKYVFASDEYNEYVNKGFNDVFGFFLNGTNIALLSDGVTPVTIDNINNDKNSDLYVDNEFYGEDAKFNTEMDGFTKVLNIEAPVHKGVTNHIKLALSDAGDGVLDSAIFFGADTFTSEPVGNLQFSEPAYSVGENGGSAVITVTRSNGTSGAVSVDYATSDGTATAGQDYGATSGTLTFAAGESSKTLSIPITDDNVAEGSETVQLALSNPTGGAELGQQKNATLTITDNDESTPPPQDPASIEFASDSYFTAEGDGTVTLTIVRSGSTDGVSTAQYCFCNKTAVNGQDYHGTSGTVTFQAGETSKTVTVDIVDDQLPEALETFGVFLKNPTGAVLGAKKWTWVSIQDNDTHL